MEVFGRERGRYPWTVDHIADAVGRLRKKGYRIVNHHGGYYRLVSEPTGERREG
jgi:hypothetical protein